MLFQDIFDTNYDGIANYQTWPYIYFQEAKISKYMDYNIYLKCENLQYTGR